MKDFKLFTIVLTIIATSILFFASCNDDNGTNPTTDSKSTGGLDGNRLWGKVAKNVTLEANKTYTLDGAVHVQNGATLTINEGAIIEAEASKTSYLLIERGGKINAVGTATNPIVFTTNAASPIPGNWGGIMVCGKATINAVGGVGVSEIGNADYGGTDDNDNSGTLSYIRVEYSGINFDEDHEANGFAFYAVGRATQIDHLQSYKGADDGFEFFGGTVNAKYLVSTHSEDDSFDWTEGWRGMGQFWLANQGGADGDRGIEGDNNKNDNHATPYSAPKLANISLLGAGFDGTYGMKLREGTKADIVNLVVTGFSKRSIHVEHNQTITNVNNDDLNIDFAKVCSNVSDKAIKYSVSKVQANEDVDGDGDIDADDEIDDPNAPTLDENKKFEVSENVEIDPVSATVITTFSNGTNPTSMDSFFESTDQIGSGSDWTNGWTKGM